ncbi:hypothetical protein [Pseudomonas sp.]|uniref:hypothetical protein n=1 Tax=Pseudomonas sp. TaxID=306 RepID=UPI003D0E0E73
MTIAHGAVPALQRPAMGIHCDNKAAGRPESWGQVAFEYHAEGMAESFRIVSKICWSEFLLMSPNYAT